MRQLSTSVKLIIALVAVIVIGQSMNLVDAVFGTDWSARSGLFFALAAAVLFVAYVVQAFKTKK